MTLLLRFILGATLFRLKGQNDRAQNEKGKIFKRSITSRVHFSTE
jgi:hypothetical protein